MPRFSDIFVYDTVIVISENALYKFTNCRLIKRVETFEKFTVFEEVTFDVSGMFLMFGQHGPYCLTTIS